MNTLYLSHDGMTDPLGQSQVIPYLEGLTELGHRFRLISCEKPARLASQGQLLRQKLLDANIRWNPVPYHHRPPVLATIWDLWKVRNLALKLYREEPFQMVHCRSYTMSLLGLWLKRNLGVKFLFDMRGFWPHERIEAGLWPQTNPLYFAIFKFFKHKEQQFLSESDAIISLTHRGKEELLRWDLAGVTEDKIQVIPCCSDLSHFSREAIVPQLSADLKQRLAIQEEDYLLGYLGSVGGWYMLEEMLDFFRCLLKRNHRAKFLFITPDARESILPKAIERGIPTDRVITQSPVRSEVPGLLSLCDASIFFIRPIYSKTGSSPTKLGELLSMELPVITNSGVGDSDLLAERYRLGPILREFTNTAYDAAITDLEDFTMPRPENRTAAHEYFSLSQGVARYAEIYQRLNSMSQAPS